ncbi:2677_t:CDS:2 [Entrophospora sp. SA101]|nr:2677_t:CDS:2 [Entrophospora sp. SA101]
MYFNRFAENADNKHEPDAEAFFYFASKLNQPIQIPIRCTFLDEQNLIYWVLSDEGLMPTDYDLARYLKKKGYNPEQELDLAQLRKGYAQNFDWEFASYLKQKGYQPDTPGIEKIVKKESWQDIHQDFRDDKVVDAETLHHTQEKKLREEYGEKPRLSDGTIEKIKKFKHNKLTFEQESLIDKLILSKELNERYKKKTDYARNANSPNPTKIDVKPAMLNILPKIFQVEPVEIQQLTNLFKSNN